MIVARRRFPKKNLALQVIRDNTQLQILFFLHLFTGFYHMNYSAGSAQRIVKSNCWVPIELLLGVKTYLGTLWMSVVVWEDLWANFPADFFMFDACFFWFISSGCGSNCLGRSPAFSCYPPVFPEASQLAQQGELWPGPASGIGTGQVIGDIQKSHISWWISVVTLLDLMSRVRGMRSWADVILV